jgi:Uncharacterized conserved protein, COG1704
MTILIIFIILLVAIFILAIFIYNRLIALQNQVREAASDIDVQLKRRYDLIPNLVNTVKGVANFEQSTLEKVIKG